MQNLRDILPPHTAEFYEARQKLLDEMPHYSCPKECGRECCKAQNLAVHVSIIDIILMAAAIDMPANEFFEKFIELDVTLCKNKDGMIDPSLWHPQWCVLRPCPFLNDDGACAIYVFRPIACRAFPEVNHSFLNQYGADPTFAVTEIFSDPAYHCFRPPISSAYINAQDKKILQLSTYTIIESRVSDLMVFGQAPIVLNISDRLNEIASITKENGDQESSQAYAKYNDQVRQIHGSEAFAISKDAVLRAIKARDANSRAGMHVYLDYCSDPQNTNKLLAFISSLIRFIASLDPRLLNGHLLKMENGNNISIQELNFTV